MLSDAGDDEDTHEKEGGDTHNAGSLKSALLYLKLIIRAQVQGFYAI